MADMLPRGLIVDMITPRFGGRIDRGGLERHVKGLVPHVHAIFIAGPSMGEGDSLSPEERDELFHRTLLAVQSRVPVLVWIGMPTADRTREVLLLLKKRQETMGYVGPVFWVDTPLYYHSNRGLVNHYEEMASAAGGAYILINDPEFVGRAEGTFKRSNIRTSVLKDLSSVGQIKGLFYSGPLERSYNYRKAVRHRPDFMIYDGDESRFLEYPGLNGVLSRGANLAPAAWRIITESSLNLNGGRGDYPDRIRQIMGAGQYLNEMISVYRGHDTRFFRQVLIEAGVLEGDSSGTEQGEMAGDAERIAGMIRDYRSNFPSGR